MKTVAAVRTEIVADIDRGAALGAVGTNGIPQKEIENKANRIRHENDDQGPQCPAHPTPAGVAIHIADHQREEGENRRRNKRDHNPNKLRLRASLMTPHEPKEANWNQDKNECCHDVRPCWNDRDLLPDSRPLSSDDCLRIHHAPQSTPVAQSVAALRFST